MMCNHGLYELVIPLIVIEGVAWVGAERLPGWRQPQEVVENDSFPAGSGIPAGNFSTRRIFCDCRQRANFLCLRPTGSRSASTGATQNMGCTMPIIGKTHGPPGCHCLACPAVQHRETTTVLNNSALVTCGVHNSLLRKEVRANGNVVCLLYGRGKSTWRRYAASVWARYHSRPGSVSSRRSSFRRRT